MTKRRTLKMTPHVETALVALREKFKTKFGREPGPNDPVFFDPDCDTPTPITKEQLLNKVLGAAKSAGIGEDRARQFFNSVPSLTNANRFPHTNDSDD